MNRKYHPLPKGNEHSVPQNAFNRTKITLDIQRAISSINY